MAKARRRLLIIGAGGSGREVAWLAETVATFNSSLAVVGFADDNRLLHGTSLNSYPVMPLEEAPRLASPDSFVVAIGAPLIRGALVARAVSLGLEPLTLIHPRVEMSRFIEIGAGTVICAGCILTTNIRLGAHVQINTNCTIAHDAVLDDFATLAPGVHISGNVHLGRDSYIGTGANVINGVPGMPVVVGRGAIVGAGACVTKSVAPNVTVVGVPAKEREAHT